MDEEYDFIILGTGLTECVMSGLMSVEGSKVLHMDRNPYYGGESTSLSPLENVYKYFYGEAPDDLTSYGKPRDWNVDLIPKFLMANGKLVQLLIHTKVTKYLEFKSIEGSYVLKSNMKIDKVPASETEAISTGLLGIMEKKRFRDFITFIHKVDPKNPSSFTIKNKVSGDSTMEQVYEYFKIDGNAQNVCGHALALYRNENYKKDTMFEFARRCKLYSDSLSRYGKSPYLYPLYGLGELPQGFARLSAIYGGTYMLDKKDAKIVYGEDGKVIGVESEGQMAKCKMVICDPSYATEKVKPAEDGKQVVRAICIMDHPIPETKNALSCQIIIPQGVVGRKNDVYISMVSSTHGIAPKGFYIAIVSTTVETNNPESEIQPGIDLLGPIKQKFVKVYDIFEQKENPLESNVFISKSYDATSHFETTCDDILRLYKEIKGQDFDFDKIQTGCSEGEEQQEQA